MKMASFGLFLLIATMSMAASTGKRSSSDPLVSTLESLPESEKENFLSYFLAIGVSQQSRRATKENQEEVSIPDGLNISDSDIQKFQEMNIPNDSIMKLVSWTQEQFDLGEEEVAHLAVQRMICHPDGQCITLQPDVNQLCCPW